MASGAERFEPNRVSAVRRPHTGGRGGNNQRVSGA